MIIITLLTIFFGIEAVIDNKKGSAIFLTTLSAYDVILLATHAP